MAHNRKLVLGGVSLTTATLDVPIERVASDVRDEIESLIIMSGYLESAPFSWISLILKFGLKDDDKPSYRRINSKYGDLPISIEMDAGKIQCAEYCQLYYLVKCAVLKSLIHVGVKHHLPIHLLQKELRIADSSR